MTCPCCSNLDYSECCEKYILENNTPSTPVDLMRSRYTAYALSNYEYIIKTTHPNTRFQHKLIDIKQWSEKLIWNKLAIINNSKKNEVEFKAYYLDENNINHIHHELSTFKKYNNQWYFYNGKIK